ncbi:ribosomal protein S18-alanine N-acetyltransferase [Azospira restricta]|uniref:[Ribosomal protein bS18]-alanine N-acetyltransferase n=1 Tax=Azospira restricta TaxID=404405 RepID=A0A974PWN2_9RHOO|nr:ribosomal protein S18-alanine N-acetyltransferase [Azospira restricta]QRJ62867.1 ribosomal protein S18-alanine N-acetyltransferase [Azospira restricta]
MSAVLAPQVEMLPMNAGDLDEIMTIESAVYPFPWTRGNFADSLAAGYSAWVCRVGGELVGYVVVMQAVDEAHLLNISVAARRQRMGFGARLLRHAMQVSRRLGAASLLLEVRPSNAAALELYQHFGFVRVGRRKAYYPAHDGREDALVLVHSLAEVKA